MVTRDATERPEAVDAGVVRIVGTDTNSLVSEMKLLLNSDEAYKRMAVAQNPYGDGQACARIVARLKQEFGYKNGL
nr:UDP-N-acetylglucosamine 2-epimerase [Pseudomonas oleovorans]